MPVETPAAIFQAPGQVQQPQDLSADKWLKEIAASEKNTEKWLVQANRVVRRFLDRRDAVEEDLNKLNLFTTNTNILISTLYARFPKPLVTREFEDMDDDVARVAANIMERMLKIRPRDMFDSAMRNVIQDRLVPGLGTLWFRYEPEIVKDRTQTVMAPDGVTVLVPSVEFEKIVDERVPVDYVNYADIRWSPARTWEEVWWVARRVKMTKEDVIKRFGQMIADRLAYDTVNYRNDENQESPEKDNSQCVWVYELWNKRTKCVYWVSKNFQFVLDKREDPLHLPNFFPTPRFLIGLHSTSNYMPRPDYLMVQDQYEELDLVNNRITILERAIKVVGVYDASNADLEQVLAEGTDNQLIGIKNFSEFMVQGGFKGAISWMPLNDIVAAMDKLREYRQDLINQIYEVTGISDIMRGATRASETATAQQLKAQYGSVRLQFLQMEVASFVEEALDIKAHIIRELFLPETIVAQSNIMLTPDAKHVQQAMQLLKSQQFELRVQVHADSMAVPEFTAERDGRMGFIRAISELIANAQPIIQTFPQAGLALIKIAQWGAASFRTGNSIESVLDDLANGVTQQLSQPPTPKPDPVIEKTKMEVEGRLKVAEISKQSAENVAMIGLKKDIALKEKDAEVERQGLEFDRKAMEIEGHAQDAVRDMDEKYKKALSQQSQESEEMADAEDQQVVAALEQFGRALASSFEKLVESQQQLIEANDRTQQGIETLIVLSKKPRKRVPKYDGNGDIVEVRDFLDEGVTTNG